MKSMAPNSIHSAGVQRLQCGPSCLSVCQSVSLSISLSVCLSVYVPLTWMPLLLQYSDSLSVKMMLHSFDKE